MLDVIHWEGDRDGFVSMIDQTQLPDECEQLEITTPSAMIAAIRRLSIRGAPAIGVAAAYGVCLATRGLTDGSAIDRALDDWLPRIREARPTAVNLHHMVDRMDRTRRTCELRGLVLRDRLLEEARSIQAEDFELCRRIGESGADLIADGSRVLTHCNAGALATAGQGTALSVMYAAHAAGRRFEVIADETRPLLQGARLTAWELSRSGIPVTLICDNAAAHLFAKREIDLVITGADRIAANGDAANKIGTYGVACLAARHGVPFYIAAPSTTFDLGIAGGDEIPIEERDPHEVWRVAGESGPPAGVKIRNPAFDVTPAELIAGWITEHGILHPPFRELGVRV
ncbi:MAG: S-methyl-5-thioribose-1-phosphate isomerase [Planctomycetes bacterium]|nr:S-methyl-5-thioribose-1-phosphate isomerase [Planctomycetota bacterium]